LPRSCKEVEEDKRLDGRHSIEEAMSAFISFVLVFFWGLNFFLCSGCDDAELSKVQERFVRRVFSSTKVACAHLSF
jgi:hypothetical protein